jgi:dienelactone hydrolase
VVRGTSVGGYLTLEMAIARPVAAIAVEEPFSFPFMGIRVGSDDTEIDTGKIERLDTPVLLIQGDQTPNINDFNRDVFIPAVLEKGKALEVQTYPGGLHSFAFYDSAERTRDPALSLQAFTAMESFFRTHVATAPIPLEARLVNWLPIEQALKLPDATPAATPDDRR